MGLADCHQSDFLEAKPCPEGKKYCVIMDNAPWHKKAIRLIWTEAYEEYADIREKLEYLSLPHTPRILIQSNRSGGKPAGKRHITVTSVAS